MVNICLVAAMSQNRVIGRDNELPWHLPADFAHFKAVTMGKTIVMGRSTFESIGKPLPGRCNIVLSRRSDAIDVNAYTISANTQLRVMTSLEDVFALPDKDLMIIGGGKLYAQTLPYATTLYLTVVDHDIEGDTYFPEIDYEQWQLVDAQPHMADERHQYAFRFLEYHRISA